MKSNSDVILRVSSTVTSRALISSNASWEILHNSSACIQVLVQLMLTNIIENGVGKQIADAASLGDAGADRGTRDVECRDGAQGDVAGRTHVKVRHLLLQAGFH